MQNYLINKKMKRFIFFVGNRSSQFRERALDGKREKSIKNETFHGGGPTVCWSMAERGFAKPDASDNVERCIFPGTAGGAGKRVGGIWLRSIFQRRARPMAR
jgi:hypothetical protein